MADSDTAPQWDSEVVLEILAQRPGLFIYTQISFCYPVPDDSSRDAIVDTLKKGLERLSASIPWTAGQVVEEDSDVSEGETRVFKIKPYQRTIPLFVKDLTGDSAILSYHEYKEAGFPLRLLKEKLVCPRGTLFGSFSDPSIMGVNPTLIVQATFIRGGLVLSILAEHHTMDAYGHGVIMDLLHKACRDEPFTSEELAAVSINRQNIIPLLDPDTYDPSVLKPRDSEKPAGPATDKLPKESSGDIATQPQWSQFHFSKSSLTAIKDLASVDLPASTPYISTDDALTAFIFQRILYARSHRLDPSVSSTIARAVNVRPYFPSIPKLYPGMVINMTQTTTTVSSALTDPLSYIAAPMRAAIDPATSTLARDTSTLATLLSVSTDKRLGGAASSFDFNVDVMLSSWAKLDCYNLDFGLGLGLPDAVRRPEFTTPFSSLMYVLPKDREGGVVLMICLRNDDMDKLRLDQEWKKLAKEVFG